MGRRTGRVALAGVGFSAIERRTVRPLGAFALEAAAAAVADCGLTLNDIDGLATYPSAPYLGAANRDGEDVITVEFFLCEPRMGEIAWYSQAGEGLVCTAMRDAVNALLAGACRYALVWRAMYVPPGTYGSTAARARPRGTRNSPRPGAASARCNGTRSPIAAISRGTARSARRWRRWC